MDGFILQVTRRCGAGRCHDVIDDVSVDWVLRSRMTSLVLLRMFIRCRLAVRCWRGVATACYLALISSVRQLAVLWRRGDADGMFG